IRRSVRSRAAIAASDRIFCGICRVLCDFLLNYTQPPHRRRAVTPSFSTRAVHAGRADFSDLGVHAPPLDLSSTYPTPDIAAAAASYDALASGEAPKGSAVYARLFNPTTDRAERALAELEGAEDAAAFASGMAAVAAVLMD